MNKFHVLTGDSLADIFRRSGIDGNIIVSREALIDGPVFAGDPQEFWDKRSEFIQSAFNAPPGEYFSNVKAEFDKIASIEPSDEVNLWFENDLFCQVNMWFTISLINKHKLTNVYRVSPSIRSNKWEGFGRHTPADLVDCYGQRTLFTKGDFTLGENLWDAYRRSDLAALAFLADSLSPCFPFVEDVCRAEIERKQNARPRKVLEDLLAQGYTDFSDIFKKFSQQEGIYGYGDLQVEDMLKKIKM